MGLIRRSDDGAVEVRRAGSGLVVQGSPTAVAAFMDGVEEATRSLGHSRRAVVDMSAVLGHVTALKQVHREYIEFSDRAKDLLTQHGAIPTGDGFFRSFVKHGRDFAGNLDWKPADLGPEQALALQTLAAQMALQAAIKDVLAAIERVEGKVDQLVELARAERLGAAAGDRQTLQPIVDRVRATGRLSQTDWSTIAPLGALIARDIESLRAYVRRQLAEVKSTPFARGRADEANELADDMVKESVALLVVVESNYALWQELRIAHAANHERDALDAITSDVTGQLEVIARADQLLVTELRDVIDRLMSPTGYEGFAPLQRSRLRKHTDELREIARWFSDQRHLDGVDRDLAELPGFSESFARVRSIVGTGAQRTTRAIASRSARLRNRKDTPTETSDDSDA